MTLTTTPASNYEGSKNIFEETVGISQPQEVRGAEEAQVQTSRWALELAAYEFEIFHRAGYAIERGALLRRPNYEGTSLSDTQLLPTMISTKSAKARSVVGAATELSLVARRQHGAEML